MCTLEAVRTAFQLSGQVLYLVSLWRELRRGRVYWMNGLAASVAGPSSLRTLYEPIARR
jgi:hypothetical protein